MARYTLRADAAEVLSPARLLTRLNTAMLAQEAPLFLTAVHATFRRTRSGAAGRVCLAGHPRPLVRRADGRVREVGRPGTLLGVVEDVDLADTRFRLAPGDLLLLYSDGAYEARPAPGAPPRPPASPSARPTCTPPSPPPTAWTPPPPSTGSPAPSPTTTAAGPATTPPCSRCAYPSATDRPRPHGLPHHPYGNPPRLVHRP